MYKKEWCLVKQIIISVALFALAMALVIGIIMPLSRHGKTMGESARDRGEAASIRLERIVSSP